FDADNKEPRHGYKPDFEITFLCCNNNSEVAKYKSSSKRFTQVEVSGSTNPDIVVVNRESAYCISQWGSGHRKYNGKTFTFIASDGNSIGEIVSAVILQDIVYVFCKNRKLHKYDSCINKWSLIYTNYIPKAGSSPVEFHGKASFIGGFKDVKRTIVTNLVDMFCPENDQTLSGPTLNVERTYCATATYN
uniref:Uncharacterized protein n=1 Tax=Ciona savignyi TaxID=51511 RepID=H2Z247_CIOSA